MITPRTLAVLAATVSAVAAVTSCSPAPENAEGARVASSPPPHNAETDRIAEVAAAAVRYPRQEDAQGFLRATLETQAARRGDLLVLEAVDLVADRLTDPRARLVYRITSAGSESGFTKTAPVTACYVLRFSVYGVVGSPEATPCPAIATPVSPRPVAPRAVTALPEDADALVRGVLVDAPPSIDVATAERALLTALPPAQNNRATGLRNLPPLLDVTTAGLDIGIALWSPDDDTCVLGARRAGRVSVGRALRMQLQAGEGGCSAQAALHPSPAPH